MTIESFTGNEKVYSLLHCDDLLIILILYSVSQLLLSLFSALSQLLLFLFYVLKHAARKESPKQAQTAKMYTHCHLGNSTCSRSSSY